MVPRVWTRYLGLSIPPLLLALVACSACEASDKTLERQLLRHAPEVIQRLRGQGCRTVGVLKFRVQKAGGDIDDRVGTLNKFLADRLEAALAMANPDDPQQQVQIVRDASSVAASIRGASHLSQEGREQLFKAQYPLAWGNRRVQVDRFLTGLVQLAADKKSFRVGILAVGAGKPALTVLLPPFEVDTDGAILHELGESFQLRGAPGEKRDAAEPAVSALQVRQDPQTRFPLQDKPAVSLLIHYDDKPVTFEFRDGEAWIPEPLENQTVTLTLERLDPGERALGAVLKVNGENTLYRERLRDFDCRKWVLRPGWRKTAVRGFQIDDDSTAQFRVASREESRGLEVYYGADVGTVSLIVFQEALPESATERVELEDNETADLIAVAQARFPEEPPADAETLKAQLRPVQSRGVIDRGKPIASPVYTEEHRWSPEPILSVVIRYYRPTDTIPAR